ncbi:hypothetical protein C8245_22995 [Paracidovorax avenae]|uniref:hypothetical protein n=1 Tax=Paracidovorax avenae TaxID=80867 RepID=UPI000D2241F9|nr:hypothetical protein [Paracidovorax avenae]AVS68146.1 hypothetical protein C8245_22995 [Paracidovorax avenae]
MKRTGFRRRERPAPAPQDREKRLEERAARLMASCTPRASVLSACGASAAPVPKEELLRSEAYRRAVASLPCAWCGLVGSSQHAHANEGKGMGIKVDDRSGFPLCAPRLGEEGCHAAFDQYRLMPGGREAHRAAADRWVRETQAQIQALGLWPRKLPVPPAGIYREKNRSTRA